MKQRLDILLIEKGYFTSREKAKTAIVGGFVTVDGKKVIRASYMIEDTSAVEVFAEVDKYVSRGGLKLEKAMAEFSLTLEGKVCMDIGASTGGFTDCMLQNGASKVFAVDVGYDQLAEKLRSDQRVINMEKTNIRYLTQEEVGQAVDFISIDVSFISLSLVLPTAINLLSEDGQLVALIKPQFEAGRENIGKKGVVKSQTVHKQVVDKIVSFGKELGFSLRGLTFSPIKGPNGNIEYLVYFSKAKGQDIEYAVGEIAKLSHETLDE